MGPRPDTRTSTIIDVLTTPRTCHKLQESSVAMLRSTLLSVFALFVATVLAVPAPGRRRSFSAAVIGSAGYEEANCT